MRNCYFQTNLDNHSIIAQNEAGRQILRICPNDVKMKQKLNDVMIIKLTLSVATFGIGFNGAETNCDIAHILAPRGGSAYEKGGDARRKF